MINKSIMEENTYKYCFKEYFKKDVIFCQPTKSNISCGQKINFITIIMFCSKKILFLHTCFKHSFIFGMNCTPL